MKSDRRLQVVCDQNVPHASELFGSYADVFLVDGRTLKSEDLVDADALVVRSVTSVDASLIANTPIQFVGSCTIGIDHLDTEYLTESGVRWCYAPGCNAQSVVEYVSSSLAALGALQEIETASVIGCGNVGGAVVHELMSLGIEVGVYDPFLMEQAAQSYGSDLAEINFIDLESAMSADLVSFHTPLTMSGPHPTNRMVGSELLLRLPEAGIVISAGRGGVIQEEAVLHVAAQRPDVRWVMDVWENEPQIRSETLELAAIATPHVAGYSVEGRRNGSWQVCQSFCEYFQRPVLAHPFSDETIQIANQSIPELSDLLLRVYDPRQDDQRMREAYADASQEEFLSGVWFDRLRKEYPARRERAAYRLKIEETPYSATAGNVANRHLEPTTLQLCEMGFNIAE